MPRPNILYVHSHDTGRYVQPYGFGIPTPRIQGLAEQGILFRQAFCAASTCSASRACLLTGQYAHSNGMLGLAHRGWSLHDYSHHIVHTLRQVGYHSTLIGEQHISKRPDVIGYDRVVKIPTTRVDDVAPVTIDILRNAPAEPFFLSVGFFETHREFFPAVAGDEHYVRPPANLPDTVETRADMAAFTASARSLDRGVGAVLDALDDTGLARQHARHLHDRPRHRLPGREGHDERPRHRRDAHPARAGRVCGRQGVGRARLAHRPLPDDLRCARDRPPRLAAGPVAAADRDRVGGRGARRRLRRGHLPRRLRAAAGDPHAAAGSYVRRFDERRLPVLPNIDDSPSKELWLRHGYAEREIAPLQLYDLVFDPNEACNVIDRPERAPASPPTWASGWSGGCATPATRCSTARSRRRPAPRSTIPASDPPAIR